MTAESDVVCCDPWVGDREGFEATVVKVGDGSREDEGGSDDGHVEAAGSQGWR